MAPPEGQEAPPTVEATIYLIHHVVLPRKLPQANDYNMAHDRLLLKTTLQALHDLKDVVRDEHLSDVDSAIAGINNSLRSRDCEGNVSEVQLYALLSELVQGKQDNFLPLEVKAQNAGVLVSRTADEVTFEFFELAPLNEASMQQGRLTRIFPGLAAGIDLSKMEEDDLLQSLSRTISKMSSQAAPGFQPQTRKAGHSHDETRDTTNPGMVTDYLMNIITAVGRASPSIRITKNTREEIMWKGTLLPWRRSSTWLLIRVTLQLHFTRKCSSFKSPDSLYKIFMVLLVARIVNLATCHLKALDGDLVHASVSKLLWRYNKIESLHQFEGLQLTWAKTILDTFENTHCKMSTLWQSIAEGCNADISMEHLASLRPENDINLELTSLDKHLAQIAGRQLVAPNDKFKPTSTYKELPAKDLPRDLKASSDDSDFSLLAIENQMIRLANVESYLAARIEDASEGTPLVDQSFGHRMSFAVQFFEQSATLQAAKVRIEQEAAINRQKKMQEFTQLKQRCGRCQVQYSAEDLRIQVFEWPLSPVSAIAKATVFETFIPEAFAAWRDACAYVAQDILGFRGETNKKPQVSYTLPSHPDLSRSLPQNYATLRVVPLSEVKPHRKTHFNIKQHMSTLTEHDLCPQNGLKYQYYDRNRGAFTEVLSSTEEVSQKCTYVLPKSSKHLELYFRKTPSAPDGTPPNDVIANLSDCPRHFALDEFRAFGTLASGRNLLYLNILLQLAMPNLDFAKVETHCLVLQLLSQTGPSAKDCIERISHHILTDDAFCRSLLSQLEIAFKRVTD
ncbi:hypothetical protein N0V86_007560 [Didymella sp. IMI 355093]|nr:hypothetical protein N0V86_007560 [Didymella sp. IMI 355093]